MRAIDHAHPLGNIVDIVDKDRALFRQLIHYKAVVHNFFANVNGRAKGVESDLHDIDGANHPGAKAPRL